MGKERIFGLDVMRFVAITTVLVGHLYWVVHIPVSLNFFFKFAFDGVSIFFTLSGYLIGNILFKKFSEKNLTASSLKSFWQSRWWRTFPAYFFVLLLLSINFLIEHKINLQKTIPYFFFLQNWDNGKIPMFGESWSLTIEEWFYLTVPFFFFLCAKYSNLKKYSPIIILAYFVFGWTIRMYKLQTLEFKTWVDNVFYIQQALPTRIDAVMFGVLGSYLNFYKFKIWSNYRLLFFLIGCIGFILQHEILYWNGPKLSNYIILFSKNLELFFCLCTLPFLSNIKTGKGYVAKFISFTAIISYSIYLLHASVFTAFIDPILPANIYARVAGYIIFAIGGGYLNYIIIEKWGLRQREKRKTIQKSIII